MNEDEALFEQCKKTAEEVANLLSGQSLPQCGLTINLLISIVASTIPGKDIPALWLDMISGAIEGCKKRIVRRND